MPGARPGHRSHPQLLRAPGQECLPMLPRRLRRARQCPGLLGRGASPAALRRSSALGCDLPAPQEQRRGIRKMNPSHAPPKNRFTVPSSPKTALDFHRYIVSDKIRSLARQVGQDFFRWEVAPVCGCLEQFTWNNKEVTPQLEPLSQDAYLIE